MIRDRLRWRPGKIVEATTETSRMKRLVIEVPGWAGHRPGQHVNVRLTTPDGYQAQRSYSIASAPEDEQLSLLVARTGAGELSSHLVDELREGSRLELRGPIGEHFVWEASAGEPLLLVAGGCGIAPLMAIIRHKTAMRSDVQTRLLYSSRSPDDIAYRGELDHLARTGGSLEVIHTFTRTQPIGWTGYRRRIDTEMLSKVAWAPEENPLVFVCGPTPLVEVAATGLVELGHEPARVRTGAPNKMMVTKNGRLTS